MSPSDAACAMRSGIVKGLTLSRRFIASFLSPGSASERESAALLNSTCRKSPQHHGPASVWTFKPPWAIAKLSPGLPPHSQKSQAATDDIF